MDVKKPFLTRFAKPVPEPHVGGKGENATTNPPIPGTTMTRVLGETTDDS